MSGIFGVVSDENCIDDLFYGTDYHSHLGKKIGGIVIQNDKKFHREIKDISLYPFRPQLSDFKKDVHGTKGLGVVGDYEPQPLIIGSQLGDYAIAHVGKVNNLDEILKKSYSKGIHFNEMSLGGVNPVELISSLINQGKNYVDGIEIMQNTVNGSSSVMLLTQEGIYVARDKFGRTPINIGKGNNKTAASFESFPFENLGFEFNNQLGPGEIGIITKEGYQQLKKPEDLLQICSFLYVYYGNPAAIYEGVEAELTRNHLGAKLAISDRKDNLQADFVSGIPDSGIGSAIGYANESRLPYKRPFIKYTETWQRSFMPQNQNEREFVAKMKLIPRRGIIKGARIVFTDDSLVRGSQSKDKIEVVFSCSAQDINFRLSCPPLMNSCKFLNFSISESIYDLAARRTIRDIEGKENVDISKYINETSDKYSQMVEGIRRKVGVTNLKYQRLNDLVSAIGLPKEKLCTYCWDGCDPTHCKRNIIHSV
ncbi:MAG: amidophosphoribosyltransferase [Candidatus Pacearchaeota archaeon]|jgi:amidophosphoribosyltransferase